VVAKSIGEVDDLDVHDRSFDGQSRRQAGAEIAEELRRGDQQRPQDLEGASR
jgi:hypothetical protein